MHPVIVLSLTLMAILLPLALPPALKEKSWKRFFLASLLSFFGVVLPLVFFFCSAGLVPDSKDACHHGWVDCFDLGKLALAPFVLWATTALYAVEIYRVKDRTRPWMVLGFFIGAIVSSVCAIYGFATNLEAWMLLVVPAYTAIWYVLRAIQLIRAANTTFFSLAMTTVSSFPFWAGSVFWSYQKYLSLPQHSQDCFVVTAASHGHRKFVGPFHSVQHRGQIRVANLQLMTLWQFEALWRDRAPCTHAFFRRAYNIIGPIIARRMTSRLVADVIYVALKPAEFFARLLLAVSTFKTQIKLEARHLVSYR